MINALKNMISQVLYTPNAISINRIKENTNGSPFENPFVQTSKSSNYAVNKPVKGGYFAGYYNGQPNIVGRRLFIEA